MPINNNIEQSSVSSDKVRSARADLDRLHIGNRYAKEFTVDPTDRRATSIVTGQALVTASEMLQERINLLDPNQTTVRDNSVITLPILPTMPGNGGWEISSNFVVNPDSSATYKGGSGENFLQTPNSVIDSIGYYFFIVEIPRIDSGYISVYDENSNELLHVTRPGRYYVEHKVTQGTLNIAKLKLVCHEVLYNDLVVVYYTGFHRVSGRVRDYFEHYFRKIDGGTGYVQEMMDAAIQAALDGWDGGGGASGLEEHLMSTNPHHIDPDTIGAAHADHTHAEYPTRDEMNAADSQVTSTLKSYTDTEVAESLQEAKDYTDTVVGSEVGRVEGELNAKIDQTKSDLLVEIDDRAGQTLSSAQAYADNIVGNLRTEFEIHKNTVNAHNVTTEVIGASPVDHSHQASDITDFEDVIMGGLNNVAKMNVLAAPGISIPVVVGQKAATPAPRTISSRYLQHTSKDFFDYYSGYAFSNTSPLTGSVVDVFRSHYGGETVVPPTFGPIDPAKPKPRFCYRHSTTRQIKKYRVYISPLYGGPTSISLLDSSGAEMHRQDNIVWESGVYTQEFIATDMEGNSEFPLPMDALDVRINDVALVSDQWAFRIEFEFGDIDTEDNLFITSGTRVSYGDSGHTHTGLVNTAVPVTIPEQLKVPGMRYYVSAVLDEQDQAVSSHVSPVPPEITQSRQGVDIFQRYYKTSDSHPLFGEPSVSSLAPGTPKRYLFSPSFNETVRTADGVTDLIIEHTFDIDLYVVSGLVSFSNDVGHSKSISLEVYSENPETNAWEWEVLTSTDEYIPCYFSTSATENIFQYTLDDSASKKIRGYRWTINSPSSDHIEINRLQMFFGDDWFSPLLNHTLTNDGHKHMFVGSIDYEETKSGEYAFFPKPFAQGTEVYIPVNGGLKCTPNTFYRIHNPFYSKNVSVSVEAIDDDGSAFGLPPTAVVAEKSDEHIYLHAQTENVFRLRVIREWG